MDDPQKFDNLRSALEAIDAGVNVDRSNFKDLIRDLQGDHECEVSFDPEDDFGDVTCDKNPGHTSFIPVKDFKIEDLPLEFRTVENFESIQEWSDLTVKINAKYISLDRSATFPDGVSPYPFYKFRGSKRIRRFGTGHVVSVFPQNEDEHGKECPCPVCQVSDQPKTEFWFAQLFTATHVVFDSSEANDVVVECFYDSDDDKSGVMKMYGIEITSDTDSEYEDVCELFCVTHDPDLIDKLQEALSTHKKTIMPHYRNNLGVLISHPHGKSRKVTIGRVLHLTIPICEEYPIQTPINFEETVTCRLPLYPWSQDGQVSDLLKTEPGKTFVLPEGVSFILPVDAKFARRVFNISTSWFVFPLGTAFKIGQDTLFLPPETEFRMEVLFENPLSYLTYDVDSCPGSSGAGLLQDGGRNLFSTFPHSGSTSVFNKSGLRSYALYTSRANQVLDVEDDEDDEEVKAESSGCLGQLLENLLPCFYPS